MLSKPEIFHGSQLKTGTTQYYDAIATNSLVDPGTVADIVHDPRETNPLWDSIYDSDSGDVNQDFVDRVASNGQFYLEKYISIYKEKEGEVAPPSRIEFRDILLKGKVNIQEFKSLIADVLDDAEDPDKIKLSDCFGDLKFVYPIPVYEFYKRGFAVSEIESYGYTFEDEALDYILEGDEEGIEKSLRGAAINMTMEQVPFDAEELIESTPISPNDVAGELGLNYGIRLCYTPPAYMLDEGGEFSGVSLSSDDPKSLREKTYKFKEASDLKSAGYSIPIATAEYSLIDEKLKKFLSDTETKNEIDMNCLVTYLTQAPEFKLLFDNCLSVKSINTIVLAYVMSNFVNSIGENDGWEVDDVSIDPQETFRFWDGKTLKSTKRILRRTFAGLYNNQEFTPSNENGLDLFGFLRGLFAFEFKLNFTWLSLWLSRQLVDEDPFDANGEECGDQYAKFFK